MYQRYGYGSSHQPVKQWVSEHPTRELSCSSLGCEQPGVLSTNWDPFLDIWFVHASNTATLLKICWCESVPCIPGDQRMTKLVSACWDVHSPMCWVVGSTSDQPTDCWRSVLTRHCQSTSAARPFQVISRDIIHLRVLNSLVSTTTGSHESFQLVIPQLPRKAGLVVPQSSAIYEHFPTGATAPSGMDAIQHKRWAKPCKTTTINPMAAKMLHPQHIW